MKILSKSLNDVEFERFVATKIKKRAEGMFKSDHKTRNLFWNELNSIGINDQEKLSDLIEKMK